MAINPSFVQVAPDGGGKYIDNAELLNPDVVVVERQITITGDPENWDAMVRVRDAAPAADDHGMISRNIDIGNYDSGLVAIPDSDDELTDTTTYVKAIILSNQTDEDQWVTVMDDASGAYLNRYPLLPRKTESIPFYGAKFAGGIHWMASQADAVNGHIVGHQ